LTPPPQPLAPAPGAADAPRPVLPPLYDYRPRAYPGDRGSAVYFDTPHIFGLRSPPRRPWLLPVVIASPFVLFFLLSGAAWDVYYTGHLTSRGWLVPATLCAVVFGGAAVAEVRRRPVTWVEVDRRRRVARLPREGTELPFERLTRLQALRVTGFRTPWSHRHAAAELQLVWTDRGRELTSCLVAQTRSRGARRFAAEFEASTGLPVILASIGVSGAVEVTPYNPPRGRAAPTGADQ
jgi:hypothetical protein